MAARDERRSLTPSSASSPRRSCPNVAEWDRDDDLPDGGARPAGRARRHRRAGAGGVRRPRPRRRGARADLARAVARLDLADRRGQPDRPGHRAARAPRHGGAARALAAAASPTASVLASFSITEPQAGSDLKRMETTRDRASDGGWCLDGTKRWVAGGASAPVIFMLVAVDGEPSCLVLPGEGRGGDGWIVGELDKIGYRGVESAAYHFDGFVSRGRRAARRRGRRGRAADARRARRRPRQRRLPRAGHHRPRAGARARGVAASARSATASSATTRTRSCALGELIARRAAVEALVDRARPRRSTRATTRRELVHRRQARRLRHRGVGGRRRLAPRRVALLHRRRTSWPGCAATRRRPRSARAPTTPCCSRSRRAACSRGPASRGEKVTLRRATRSALVVTGAQQAARAAPPSSTTRISSSAKAAPRQRRTPPPNGIQAYVSGLRSRKRSGRNAYGLGVDVRVGVGEPDRRA